MAEHITKNFVKREFACKHCGIIRYDEDLVYFLQSLRDATKHPIIITSGYRCHPHHISIYKSRYGDKWQDYITWNSAHIHGKAADFYVQNMDIKVTWKYMEDLGMKYICGAGTYPETKPPAIHVDTMVRRYQRWVLRHNKYHYLF